MTLIKTTLHNVLFNNIGLSKSESKKMVKLFFEEIKSSLENGEKVKISGFGQFELRNKNNRPGRNPKTGESVNIDARRVTIFRPSQKLLSRIEKIT